MKFTDRCLFICLTLATLIVTGSSFVVSSTNYHRSLSQRHTTTSIYISEDDVVNASEEEKSAVEAAAPPKPEVKCPDCDLCDGSGRIMGGIGAVLPFIPIKAYRPCPNYVNRGGIYERAGQGLDEIAFGRDSTYEN